MSSSASSTMMSEPSPVNFTGVPFRLNVGLRSKKFEVYPKPKKIHNTERSKRRKQVKHALRKPNQAWPGTPQEVKTDGPDGAE